MKIDQLECYFMKKIYLKIFFFLEILPRLRTAPVRDRREATGDAARCAPRSPGPVERAVNRSAKSRVQPLCIEPNKEGPTFLRPCPSMEDEENQRENSWFMQMSPRTRSSRCGEIV
jgi:hypothetical protein